MESPPKKVRYDPGTTDADATMRDAKTAAERAKILSAFNLKLAQVFKLVLEVVKASPDDPRVAKLAPIIKAAVRELVAFAPTVNASDSWRWTDGGRAMAADEVPTWMAVVMIDVLLYMATGNAESLNKNDERVRGINLSFGGLRMNPQVASVPGSSITVAMPVKSEADAAAFKSVPAFGDEHFKMMAWQYAQQMVQAVKVKPEDVNKTARAMFKSLSTDYKEHTKDGREVNVATYFQTVVTFTEQDTTSVQCCGMANTYGMKSMVTATASGCPSSVYFDDATRNQMFGFTKWSETSRVVDIHSMRFDITSTPYDVEGLSMAEKEPAVEVVAEEGVVPEETIENEVVVKKKPALQKNPLPLAFDRFGVEAGFGGSVVWRLLYPIRNAPRPGSLTRGNTGAVSKGVGLRGGGGPYRGLLGGGSSDDITCFEPPVAMATQATVGERICALAQSSCTMHEAKGVGYGVMDMTQVITIPLPADIKGRKVASPDDITEEEWFAIGVHALCQVYSGLNLMWTDFEAIQASVKPLSKHTSLHLDKNDPKQKAAFLQTCTQFIPEGVFDNDDATINALVQVAIDTAIEDTSAVEIPKPLHLPALDFPPFELPSQIELKVTAHEDKDDDYGEVIKDAKFWNYDGSTKFCYKVPKDQLIKVTVTSTYHGPMKVRPVYKMDHADEGTNEEEHEITLQQNDVFVLNFVKVDCDWGKWILDFQSEDNKALFKYDVVLKRA